MDDEMIIFSSLTTTFQTYYTVPSNKKVRIVKLNIAMGANADAVSIRIKRSGISRFIWNSVNCLANTTYQLFDFPGLKAGDEIEAKSNTATNIDFTGFAIIRDV